MEDETKATASPGGEETSVDRIVNEVMKRAEEEKMTVDDVLARLRGDLKSVYQSEAAIAAVLDNPNPIPEMGAGDIRIGITVPPPARESSMTKDETEALVKFERKKAKYAHLQAAESQAEVSRGAQVLVAVWLAASFIAVCCFWTAYATEKEWVQILALVAGYACLYSPTRNCVNWYAESDATRAHERTHRRQHKLRHLANAAGKWGDPQCLHG